MRLLAFVPPPARSATAALVVLMRRGGLETMGRRAKAWDRLRRALWCLPRNAWAKMVVGGGELDSPAMEKTVTVLGN